VRKEGGRDCGIACVCKKEEVCVKGCERDCLCESARCLVERVDIPLALCVEACANECG